MKSNTCYENYPFPIVFASNLVSISIYTIGALVIYQIGIVWLVLYLIYILFLELKLLKTACTACYYYGKLCAFGKGKLSSLFFKKGDPNLFIKRKITWKDIIPDFMVSVIPIIAGIVLLIIDFNWWLLAGVIVLILLTSVGNGIIRGSLACRHCKQLELGCPAQQLFNKTKH